jgi:hypothetical protein
MAFSFFFFPELHQRDIPHWEQLSPSHHLSGCHCVVSYLLSAPGFPPPMDSAVVSFHEL